MKITHIVQGYYPAHGGTEYFVKRLSENLKSVYDDEVSVLTTFAYNIELFRNPKSKKINENHREELVNGVNIKRFDVSNKFWFVRKILYGFSKLLRLPLKEYFQVYYLGPNSSEMKKYIKGISGPSIIMASSFPLMHMYYALLGKKEGVSVVLHGALHVEDKENYENKRIFEAIRLCDSYIANTLFEKEYLIDKGIPEDKIKVIGIGVDLPLEGNKNREKFRNKYSIGRDEILFAFIGQQAFHKGILNVIHSFNNLTEKYSNLKLVIAGAPTSFESKIKEELAGLDKKNKKRIIHLGVISEDEKNDILSGCDIFVSPSCRESFGITYIEAWSHRKPVIACNIAAVSSLIDEYEDGLLINFGDEKELESACVELIEDSYLRKKLGYNGFNKVKNNYTWDIVAKKFRDVYLNLNK
jgi:glycosyltransferase involved in cell wall biosynthesis